MGEDFNKYLKIFEVLGDKPGGSNWIRNIINTKSNKDALNLILNDLIRSQN